jgi:pimeloyl-ACP methyl ester carboxylesterase
MEIHVIDGFCRGGISIKHLLSSLLVSAAAAVYALEMAEPRNVPPLFPAGDWVPNAQAWHDGRRAEIKKVPENEVYGRRPVERPPHLAFSEMAPEKEMMDGKAIRRLVRIEYGGKYGTNSFSVTAFVPKSSKPVPAFVFICNRSKERNIDPDRIVKSDFWPAEQIVERGYAAITFYMGDVTPDAPHGNRLGVFAAFSDLTSQYRVRREWGALSAWAWGASRVLDWIETQSDIDAKHIAVIGHSRGGKVALVAAAWDERFAMVCSNDSGCGGAKLNHIDLPGSEKFVNLCSVRNFWFNDGFVSWVNRDTLSPWDQHWLVALIAPRLVCIGSATEDDWAGPYGEYCTARYASPVWKRVFGKKGFVTSGFPDPDTPQQEGDISYHIRTGKHDLTVYDWNVYMDFADRHGWNK